MSKQNTEPITAWRVIRISLYIMLYVIVLLVSVILGGVLTFIVLPCQIGTWDCSGTALAMIFIAPPLGCCLSPILFALLYNVIQWVLNRNTQKQKRKNGE